MATKPDHITGAMAATWDNLASRVPAGSPVESTPIVLAPGEEQGAEIQALVAAGGATVTNEGEQTSLQLICKGEDQADETSMTAAAKKQKFA